MASFSKGCRAVWGLSDEGEEDMAFQVVQEAEL